MDQKSFFGRKYTTVMPFLMHFDWKLDKYLFKHFCKPDLASFNEVGEILSWRLNIGLPTPELVMPRCDDLW